MRLPLYMSAYNKIVELVNLKGYSQGEKLPPIRSLARSFRVSKISVQQAVKMLCQEGKLRSIPGGGLYINQVVPPPEAPPEPLSTPLFTVPRRKALKFATVDFLPHQMAVWQAVIDKFKSAQPYVEIEVQPGKTMPDSTQHDIIQISAHLLEVYVDRGQLFDLTELDCLPVDERSFYASVSAATQYAGKCWGVPVLVSPAWLCFNRDHAHLAGALEQAGSFWAFMDGLKDLSRRLDGTTATAALVSNFDILSLLMLAGLTGNQRGEEIIESLPAQRPFFSRLEPYFRDARIFWRPPVADAWMGLNKAEKLERRVLTGETVFLSNSTNIAMLLNRREWAAGNFQLASFPTESAGSSNLSANVNCVSATTRFPLECAEFLTFLASEEIQNMFAAAGIWVGHRNAFATFQKTMPQLGWDKLREATEHGRAMRTKYSFLNELITQVINPEIFLWQRYDLSLEQALSNIERKSKFFIRSAKSEADVSSRTADATPSFAGSTL